MTKQLSQRKIFPLFSCRVGSPYKLEINKGEYGCNNKHYDSFYYAACQFLYKHKHNDKNGKCEDVEYEIVHFIVSSVFVIY